MNHHRLIASGSIAIGLLLVACLSSQIPLHVPSVSVPSVPSLAVPTLSVPSIPSLTVPTVVMPTLNAPAIDLTLVIGAGATPVAGGTAARPVPVTGSPNQAARWLIYALLAILGIVLVVAMFAHSLKRSDTPDQKPPTRPLP